MSTDDKEASVQSVVMPTVGDVWNKRGFDFRIDHISADEIFMVRFAWHENKGTAVRVSREVWRDAMSDAKRIDVA